MDDAPSPGRALRASASIAEERGRWVVSLTVLSIPDRDDYVTTVRIADYPTRQAAEVAARWIVGAADRQSTQFRWGF
jgi:hypothetical protein